MITQPPPELIADALVRGSTIALLAVGLTLVYSTMRFANVAHGEFATVGAYAAISQHAPQKVTTAFDRRLGEINTELARSTVTYGRRELREAGEAKALEATKLPAGPAADRAAFGAKAGRAATYDLLDAVKRLCG